MIFPAKLTFKEAFTVSVAINLVIKNPAWTEEEVRLLESAYNKLGLLENEEPQQERKET